MGLRRFERAIGDAVPPIPPKTIVTVQKTAKKLNLGYTRGLLRDATGQTPSAWAQRSRGRGGWMHRKCSKCNRLRDQPKVACQCLNLRELPHQPGRQTVPLVGPPSTGSPDGRCIQQMARQLTDSKDSFARLIACIAADRDLRAPVLPAGCGSGRRWVS